MMRRSANVETPTATDATTRAPDHPQEHGFERVVLPHLSAGFTLARYLTGNAQDAEDAVQDAIVRAMYVKSVTAPIAMGVAERIGASPTLTAVFAISTGILGAVVARTMLDAVRCSEWWQRGFALGVAAHGIGTARAFSVNVEAGTFASVAMGLHGVVGALVIPLVAR